MDHVVDDQLVIRRTRADDVATIVAMLADDPRGAKRERPGDPRYDLAFKDVDGDPRQLLVVAELGGAVVGTLQLSFIPGLAWVGGTRAQIEAVRVRSDRRGGGLGRRLMEWAIDEARRRGAVMVQLTTAVSRTDAHRFYERLGFVPSHVGMKLVF